MPDASPVLFPAHIFADIRARAQQTVLCEKQGAAFQFVTLREAATRLSSFVRALSAAGLVPGDRVTFYAGASPQLLVAEWAVLASQCISVIAPRSFSPEDLDTTLIESKSRLVVVDRLATAYHLADRAATLPDLRLIVCLEGGAEAALPIRALGDFIDAGLMEPDRSTAQMRAILPKDTALMFYYKDAAGALQATRYSHALLMEHAARVETLLGKSSLRKGELAVTATTWEHPIGHIVSCYAPLLKEAVVQVTYGTADIVLLENQPEVAVGDAAFFSDLRAHILQTVRQGGQLESSMLKMALSFSRQHYVAPRNIGPLSRLLFMILKATIVKKVKRMLGGRLRLLISIDDEANYETQLFFQAFGVELIELPPEMFK